MYLTSGTNHAGFDYNPVGTLGEPLHGYARWTPASAFQFANETGIQRMTGSADAQWRPLTWLQNQAVVGVDLADQIYFDICRFTECPAFGTNRAGFVDDEPRQQPHVHGEAREQLVVERQAVAEPQDDRSARTTSTTRAKPRAERQHAAARRRRRSAPAP